MTPYTGSYRVSSPFGARELNGTAEYHKGIDLVGIESKAICAAVSGYVIQSRMVNDTNNLTWQWGNYVCIAGDDGRYYYYCHMSQREVSIGEYVRAGEVIGVEGNTGYSFGSHLHFEVREGSAIGNSIDPSVILGIENVAGTIFQPEKVESENEKLAKENAAAEWSYEAVVNALDDGILKGDGDSLRLKDNVTREELCVILDRYAKRYGLR